MPRLGGTHVVVGAGELLGSVHGGAANTIAKHMSPITIHIFVALMTRPSQG